MGVGCPAPTCRTLPPFFRSQTSGLLQDHAGSQTGASVCLWRSRVVVLLIPYTIHHRTTTTVNKCLYITVIVILNIPLGLLPRCPCESIFYILPSLCLWLWVAERVLPPLGSRGCWCWQLRRTDAQVRKLHVAVELAACSCRCGAQ